ncbi:MAG: redoxin domain-containing protein [Hyphomicrobium zavarzinii]|uniref:peroxiredoxin family protein n=1 Tax=Hyphomicrobium zavarzinii TaxID=48292 RepID=UPI001A543DD4|nr:redoxin domain-containing protein [Hyphomicrobium zavarzinii]MBL8845604.1 redoxin domain-containing protein [Hyphomicrobium zavarzinii]
MTDKTDLAPEFAITRWFNTPAPLKLENLRGRIVILHAFQMLCPGCVAHGTPQAEKLHRLLHGNDDVAVIGLHTVFEHHEAMTPVSLEAFIHEYRLTMPIGVDQAGDGTPIPITMQRYGMRGTPTTIIIDRTGRIRHHGFGQDDDLALGLRIGALLAESNMKAGSSPDDGCASGACTIPEAAN